MNERLVVLDAFALLALVNDEPAAGRVEDVLRAGTAGELATLMSE